MRDLKKLFKKPPRQFTLVSVKKHMTHPCPDADLIHLATEQKNPKYMHGHFSEVTLKDVGEKKSLSLSRKERRQLVK